MSVIVGPKITNSTTGGVMDGANPGDNYSPYGNGFLRMMQALIQPNVISVTTGTPPASPGNGDTYVIPAGATGIWATKTGQIAYYTTDTLADVVPGWDYYTPLTGWQVFNNADSQYYRFNGSTWIAISVFSSGTTNQLAYYSGSNTIAGNANFTVSSGTLTCGVTGSAAGSLVLSGATTGGATLTSQATGGSLVISLPNTAPSVNQVLAATGVSGSNITLGWASQSNAFSALTSATNTTAAMVVGSGASLAVSGTGTIAATTVGGLKVQAGRASVNNGGTVSFGTAFASLTAVTIGNYGGSANITSSNNSGFVVATSSSPQQIDWIACGT